MRGPQLAEMVIQRVIQEDEATTGYFFLKQQKEKANTYFGLLGIAMAALGPLYKSIEEYFDSVTPKQESTEDDEPSSLAKVGDWIKDLFKSDNKEDQATTVEKINLPSKQGMNSETVSPGVIAAQPIIETLRKAASKNNIAFATLFSIAGIESNFKADAKAGTSTAVGMFQFTEGTWNYLVKTLYPNLNYTLSDRQDPEKAAAVAALYLNTIGAHLKKTVGKDPSLSDLYLGYFMGPSGASKFLLAMQENSGQIAATLFPQQAAANRNVFYTGDRALTLAEVMQKLSGRLQKYESKAQALSSGTSSTPLSQTITSPTTDSNPPKPSLYDPSIPQGVLDGVSSQEYTVDSGKGVVPDSKPMAPSMNLTRDRSGRVFSLQE